MSIPTVAVTARVHTQHGDPIQGAIVTAKLATTERYNGYVVPKEYSGTTDASGVCVLDVFPNELGTEGSEYKFKILDVSTGKSVSVMAVVPNPSRAVTIKNAAGGAGQIFLACSADKPLSGMAGNDAIILHRIGANWYELSFAPADVDAGNGLFAKNLGQIGKIAKYIGDNQDINTFMNSGFYTVTATGQTNGPGLNAGILHVLAASTGYVCQVYYEYLSASYQRIAYRRYYNGTWGAWREIGSPPTATAGIVGEFKAHNGASGAAATLPAGGTWAYMLTPFNASTGAQSGSVVASVAAGGTTVGAATGGIMWIGFMWRVA